MNGNPLYGEVLYFFRIQGSPESNDLVTCTMISLSTPVDPTMLQDTYGVLSLCSVTRYEAVRVYNVCDIDSVVAFLPFDAQQFFIVEELGVVPENFEEFQSES